MGQEAAGSEERLGLAEPHVRDIRPGNAYQVQYLGTQWQGTTGSGPGCAGPQENMVLGHGTRAHVEVPFEAWHVGNQHSYVTHASCSRAVAHTADAQLTPPMVAQRGYGVRVRCI